MLGTRLLAKIQVLATAVPPELSAPKKKMGLCVLPSLGTGKPLQHESPVVTHEMAAIGYNA